MYDRLERTRNGVPYDWSLSGPDGATFLLFPEPHHTKEDVKAAKRQIRDEQDCVGLRVAQDDDYDYLYRSSIFRVPETKMLQWFEMNVDDEKLIRRERLAGTTPQEYVDRYVLPFVKQTREANFAKHPHLNK